MSDPVHCHNCGTYGRRRLGKIAPEDWFYAEVSDDEDPEEITIIYACSVECKRVEWKPGPGKLAL